MDAKQALYCRDEELGGRATRAVGQTSDQRPPYVKWHLLHPTSDSSPPGNRSPARHRVSTAMPGARLGDRSRRTRGV